MMQVILVSHVPFYYKIDSQRMGRARTGRESLKIKRELWGTVCQLYEFSSEVAPWTFDCLGLGMALLNCCFG